MSGSAIDWTFISADSHIVEPRDLFTGRTTARFRDRVPRVESDDRCDWLIVEGLEPRPLGIEGSMINSKANGEIVTNFDHRYEENRAGATDVNERIKDQEGDNVVGEVLYPWMCLLAAKIPDIELKAETFRIYNDWLAESFVAKAPDRVVGAGLLPLGGDIELAIAEAQRCAELGLRTYQLPAVVAGHPYEDPYFEPLWSALEEIGAPVSFHSGSGEDAFDYPFVSAAVTVPIKMKLHQVLSQIVYGGIAERHPALRMVLVESGLGWIASAVTYMDHWWGDHRTWLDPQLPVPPSEYVHRQVWATFEDDRAGILTMPLLNVDHVMWGNDYPHTEGLWPASLRTLPGVLEGLSVEDQRKVTHDNAAALYGL